MAATPIATAVSTTCRPPSPKIGLRSSHSSDGLQLEPDEEQHHHDAELGEVHDVRRFADEAEHARADHDAGDEVAEHGAEAEPREQRRGDDRGGQVDERAGQELLKMHRRAGGIERWKFGGSVKPSARWRVAGRAGRRGARRAARDSVRARLAQAAVSSLRPA